MYKPVHHFFVIFAQLVTITNKMWGNVVILHQIFDVTKTNEDNNKGCRS